MNPVLRPGDIGAGPAARAGQRVRRLLSCTAVLVLLLSHAACGGTRPNDLPEASQDNLDLALAQAVDLAILPAVQAFRQAADSYAGRAEAFCAAPGASGLDTLQQDWRALFNAWYALSNYNFGPLNADPVFPQYIYIDSLRLRGTDYLATVRGEIASDIADTQTLDAAYFAGKTFQRVGLLALESVSFETASSDHSQVPDEIVAEFVATPRKCQVLIGLADQVRIRAEAVSAGWRETFAGGPAYRDRFLSGELEDGSVPITQLIVSVQEFLDYLQARNVVETAARVSGSAWDAIAAAIDQVELLLEGNEQTSVSFFSIMQATGNQLAVERVRATIRAVRETIVDRDAGMLEIRLGELDGNFKREIPGSLDVELGINFSDGD